MDKRVMATGTITESSSLEMHVELCAERYGRLEEKFKNVEHRLDQLHDDFSNFKSENSKNLSEIKTLLGAAKDEKFKTMVTTAGTVIVALLGMLGYVLMHLK
jgi:FtsZ-binding cell division protein ZapB